MCSCNEELTDPLYRSEGFMMFCYKILPCKKSYRHDWRVCPFAHGDETAKRRDPRIYKYTGVICPDAKKGRSCPRGDDCPCTHSLFEYWLHPTRFKTEICSRGSRCNRPFCFFAHKQSEIRKPNFRVQMQGITCEPIYPSLTSSSMTDGQLNGHCMHKTTCHAAAAKRVPFVNNHLSPIFPPVSKVEGTHSLPDSGSSSCEFDFTVGPWNSLLGNDSPRNDTKHAIKNGSSVQTVLPTSNWCPIFPQIPCSESNAVDWSIWHPTQSKPSTATLFPAVSEGMWNFIRNPSIGPSHRMIEAHNVAESLKDVTPNALDDGYDRNYLLATIRDVYQSMLAGCNNGGPTNVTEGHCHASFGRNGLGDGNYFRSNGICAQKGVQHNGCVSQHGMSFCSANDPSSMERTLYTLLGTDSGMDTCYFK